MIFEPHKVLRKKDIEHLLNQMEDGVEVGYLSNFSDDFIINFFRLWCFRIDKIIQMDKAIYGEITWRSKDLIQQRGFTYTEFKSLFNSNISANDFINYPIFNQLNRIVGGITNEKQRTDFTLLYEYNEESYRKILENAGFLRIIQFFFAPTFPNTVPLAKLKMHTHIVAPTGSGKSELIRTMFYQMQKRYKKFSFILIDPHGDLARKVKKSHLNKNKDRFVYIAPYLKNGYSPTFNVFDIKDKSIKNISHTVEQVIISFDEILTKEGGKVSQAMLNMLEKCLYFLLLRKESTFSDLEDLLNLEKPIWTEAKEYDKYFGHSFEQDRRTTRVGLLDRVGRLLNSYETKNLLSGKSTFDLEKLMNSGKVIIFDLGDLGEMAQETFGKFLVATIKSLVRKRDIEKHVPTFMFVDECQNLISGSFEYILSQLRKYGLHLILANQYATQLGDQLEAVKKNTAVKIIGGDEYEDMKKVVKIDQSKILKDFEFFLKVRGRTLLQFKSPSYLINDKKYSLVTKEEKQLDEYMIKKYYKLTQHTQHFPNQPITKGQKKLPPYNLFLGDDSTDK